MRLFYCSILLVNFYFTSVSASVQNIDLIEQFEVSLKREQRALIMENVYDRFDILEISREGVGNNLQIHVDEVEVFDKKEKVFRGCAASALSVGCALAIIPVYLSHLEGFDKNIGDGALYPLAIYTGLSFGAEFFVKRFFGSMECSKEFLASVLTAAASGLMHVSYFYDVEAEHGFSHPSIQVFFGVLAPFLFINETLNKQEEYYSWFLRGLKKELIHTAQEMTEDELEKALESKQNLFEMNQKQSKFKKGLSFLLSASVFTAQYLSFQSFFQEEFDKNKNYEWVTWLSAAVPSSVSAVSAYKTFIEFKVKKMNLFSLQSLFKSVMPSVFTYTNLNAYGQSVQILCTSAVAVPAVFSDQKGLRLSYETAKTFIKKKDKFKLKRRFMNFLKIDM